MGKAVGGRRGNGSLTLQGFFAGRTPPVHCRVPGCWQSLRGRQTPPRANQGCHCRCGARCCRSSNHKSAAARNCGTRRRVVMCSGGQSGVVCIGSLPFPIGRAPRRSGPGLQHVSSQWWSGWCDRCVVGFHSCGSEQLSFEQRAFGPRRSTREPVLPRVARNDRLLLVDHDTWCARKSEWRTARSGEDPLRPRRRMPRGGLLGGRSRGKQKAQRGGPIVLACHGRLAYEDDGKRAFPSVARVQARLSRAAWILLNACLVRFLARDDGRYAA
jgi:hypothetical protein